MTDELPVNAQLYERLKKRHAEGKYWVQPYWITRVIDGAEYLVTTVARSRALRRKGIEVKIPMSAIADKTLKEQEKIMGPHLAQALDDLGLGWMVKKNKVAADKENLEHGSQH